jgi:hypothetical protein
MPTRPLTLIAIGVVMVAVELRVTSVDALADPIGWGMVTLGAWRLAYRWSAALAAGAALGSLLEVALPFHYRSINPISGEIVADPAPGTQYREVLVFDQQRGVQLLVAMAVVFGGGLALCSILWGLRGRARHAGDGQSVRWLGWLVAATSLLWVAPYLVRAGSAATGPHGFDPVWNGGWEIPAMVAIAVLATVALFLARSTNEPWAMPAGGPGSQWDLPTLEGRRLGR